MINVQEIYLVLEKRSSRPLTDISVYAFGTPDEAYDLEKRMQEAIKNGALSEDCEVTTCTVKLALRTWTVAICELKDGNIHGTHHVSAHEAYTLEQAIELAKEETCADWLQSMDEINLHALWVAEGNVNIIQYDELAG